MASFLLQSALIWRHTDDTDDDDDDDDDDVDDENGHHDDGVKNISIMSVFLILRGLEI